MRLIFLSLMSLGFLSQTSFALERIAFGNFWGQGQSCQDAIFHAERACYEAIEEFSHENNLTRNPHCGACRCGWTAGLTKASCLGTAHYDDGADCGNSRRLFKLQSAWGRGLSCSEAEQQASAVLYQWLREFSAENIVVSGRLGRCTCGGGGIFDAQCQVSVTHVKCQADSREPEPILLY